jgi:hypothetical protein
MGPHYIPNSFLGQQGIAPQGIAAGDQTFALVGTVLNLGQVELVEQRQLQRADMHQLPNLDRLERRDPL